MSEIVYNFTSFSEVVGTTTVKVTVEKSGKTILTQNVSVKVKKNAGSLAVKGIEDGATYKIDEELTISLPVYADGKKTDTDLRTVTCDNEKVTIKDNGNRTFSVSFAEGGDYTLVAKSYQSKSYTGATQTKEFAIKVDAPAYEVKQTKYNAFTMTFPSKTAAAEACETTKKSLTQGTAIVTQDKDVVKVFQIGDNKEKISAFIGDVTLKDNVLTLTMFADLAEGKTYSVEYMDFDPVEFVAVKWIPTTLKNNYSYVPNMEEKGGTAKLSFTIETVEGVDITGKVSQAGMIEYTDGDSKNQFDKYSVTGEQVDFYQDSVVAPVNAKFTWYGAADAKSVDLTNSFSVIAKDTRKYCVEYYLLDPTNKGHNDLGKKRDAVISVDDNVKILNIRIAVDIDNDGVYGDDFDGNGTPGSENDYIYCDDPNVKFVTSNADKLNVTEFGGSTYAPKEASEVVGVYVYYKDQLIDADINADGINPIPVTVYAKKTLGDLKVALKDSDGKFSYSTTAKADGTDAIWYDSDLTYPINGDSEKFEIKAVDQFGNDYSNVRLTLEKTTDVLDDSKGKVYLDGTQIKKGDVPIMYADNLGTITPEFTAESKDNAVRTISFKVTAEDLITKKSIVKTFSFTVKNTTESTIVSQVVEGNSSNTEFSVYGKDSAGYKVCGYYLAEKAEVEGSTYETSKVYLDVFRNSNGVCMDAQTEISLDKKKVTFTTTERKVGGGLTKVNSNTDVKGGISGKDIAAIIKYQNSTGSAISYIASGSYSAKAYKLNKSNKLAILNSKAFNYEPNKHDVEWVWKTAYAESSSVAAVLDEAFTFTTYKWINDNGTWKWAKDVEGKKFIELSNVAVSYIEQENMISFLYIYVINPVDNTVIVETPINRNVYTGIAK